MVKGYLIWLFLRQTFQYSDEILLRGTGGERIDLSGKGKPSVYESTQQKMADPAWVGRKHCEAVWGCEGGGGRGEGLG